MDGGTRAITAKYGWAIGDPPEDLDVHFYDDARDAESLYRLLEEQIVPLFFDRDQNWASPRLDSNGQGIRSVPSFHVFRQPGCWKEYRVAHVRAGLETSRQGPLFTRFLNH